MKFLISNMTDLTEEALLTPLTPSRLVSTPALADESGRRLVSLVRVGQVMMPSSFEAFLVEHEDGHPDVSFTFEVRNGVPECREVHIVAADDGHEIRCSGLAGIRVEDVLEEAIRRLFGASPAPGDRWPTLYASEDEKRDAVRGARSARAGRRVTMTDELLQEVAQVYRAHVDGHPTQAVAAHFDKEPRTARLYVQRAREAGHLGAAIRGKAGEQ